MIPIRHNLFPGGRCKALTLSYDDGVVHDRRLVEIFNRYGLKGTFHLNSGFLGREGKISPEEVSALFHGHEISAHTVTHPFLEQTPRQQFAQQILDDRRNLEALAGYPVRGMSYPFGTYDSAIVAALPGLGICYARTVESHGRFSLPENPLLWHPTCHHKQMLEKADAFLAENRQQNPQLFYVWGHSYEFHNDNNWELIETFGTRIQAAGSQIWFATNIEIIDYLDAVKRLRISADGSLVENPSLQPVWITWDGKSREIAPGELARA
jgi:hypothetical protein